MKLSKEALEHLKHENDSYLNFYLTEIKRYRVVASETEDKIKEMMNNKINMFKEIDRFLNEVKV